MLPVKPFRLLLIVLSFCSCLMMNAPRSEAEEMPAFSDLPAQKELPDPFTFQDGSQVTGQQQWTKRREELKQLFQHYMYGYLAPAPEFREWKETQRVPVMQGKAELIEGDYRVGPAADKTITMHIAIVRPAQAKGPVPVFWALNRCGNMEILPDPEVTVHDVNWANPGCKGKERGNNTNFWALETVIGRGYAFATCHVDDIDPDYENFDDGVHPLYVSWFEEQGIAPEHRWGTISAWAWGLHRGVDLLSELPEIDAKRISVIGHSRRGKTALLAAALDDRIALVVPHQSGTGGMALSRENNEETVTRINKVFPHWFCDQFNEFGGHEQKLPIDQHLLIALVAPRPLMETSGLQDTWANFISSWQAIQAASPAYQQYQVTGLKEQRPFTAEDKINSETVGRLLQYRLDTKHVLNKDYWEGILDFADLHLGKPAN